MPHPSLRRGAFERGQHVPALLPRTGPGSSSRRLPRLLGLGLTPEPLRWPSGRRPRLDSDGSLDEPASRPRLDSSDGQSAPLVMGRSPVRFRLEARRRAKTVRFRRAVWHGALPVRTARSTRDLGGGPVRRLPGVAPGRGAAAPAVGRPRTTIGYVSDQQLRAGSAPRAGCCTGERRETPAVAGSNPERWRYALEGSPSGLWHLLGKQEGHPPHASSNLALSARRSGHEPAPIRPPGGTW